MVHIGATSRGDSFPLSSTAPRSHFIHSPRPCNPEIHVIMCPKPVWEKKCHIDGADQTVTLIAVKSSTNALNHSPVRLPAGLTPPNRTISLLETKRVDQVVNLKYLCLLPKLQPDISKRRNIRYHQIRNTGGRNQLSNKLGTTLSVGLNPAVTSVTRNRLYPTSHLLHLQLFSHRLSPRHAVAGLCMCLVTFTEHLGLFWEYFRFFLHLQTCTRFSIQVIAAYPPTASFRYRISWVTGCILHVLLHHHEPHFMFIHSTLLYLSLDGVIPEAFIMYISYNISWVSPLEIDRLAIEF